MAKPRIFVSSTYFDLRVVRADLERFIRENGYEPVLFEHGHIPYGKEDALEEYCYREISTCDILIAIIGGAYGTQSRDQKHSITQREFKTAIELGKQIYVFVERSVHSEYRTYRHNKDVEGFKPVAVTDARVYQFLDEINSLPAGNPIEPFEISDDIVRYLREQWAGLFQRLLQESGRQKEINIVASMKSTAATLNKLVTFLTEQRTKGDEAIKDILLSSHPAFGAIKTAANIPYRVVFHTFRELDTLLSNRGFTHNSVGTQHEWYNDKPGYGIRVS
ncbi:MAG: DUF4062 domain-containing protein, partial [Phycisphaeraceae bacterium]